MYLFKRREPHTLYDDLIEWDGYTVQFWRSDITDKEALAIARMWSESTGQRYIVERVSQDGATDIPIFAYTVFLGAYWVARRGEAATV